MSISTEELLKEIQKPKYKEEPLDVWLDLDPVKVNYIFYFDNQKLYTLGDDNEILESWTLDEFLFKFTLCDWIIN